MGMCFNIKKTQKNEIEHSIKVDKENIEKAKSEKTATPIEDEFKDFEEWEGKNLLKNFTIKKGEKFSGVGIKCIKGYKCDLPIDDLMNLRDKFWSKIFC